VAALFSESASRVVVSIDPSRVSELRTLAAETRVPLAIIGRVRGYRIRVAVAGRGVLDEPVADAERLWSDAIGSFFESQRAIA
jgi:phosphoribosylformylglycinamidine synthase